MPGVVLLDDNALAFIRGQRQGLTKTCNKHEIVLITTQAMKENERRPLAHQVPHTQRVKQHASRAGPYPEPNGTERDDKTRRKLISGVCRNGRLPLRIRRDIVIVKGGQQSCGPKVGSSSVVRRGHGVSHHITHRHGRRRRSMKHAESTVPCSVTTVLIPIGQRPSNYVNDARSENASCRYYSEKISVFTCFNQQFGVI